jgi:hypothetical protein
MNLITQKNQFFPESSEENFQIFNEAKLLDGKAKKNRTSSQAKNFKFHCGNTETFIIQFCYCFEIDKLWLRSQERTKFTLFFMLARIF